MLGVLLKKQMTEKLSYFKRDKKRIDIVGALLTLVMTAFIMYVVIEVFGAFVAKYTEIRLNGVRDVRARQYEIMTFVYEFVFAVDVIGGVVAINRAIFESDDRMIIQTLPVKASDVLYSKIIFIYAKQVLSAFVILVPFVAVFASVTKQGRGIRDPRAACGVYYSRYVAFGVERACDAVLLRQKVFLVEVRLPSGDSNAGAFRAVLLLCDGARLLKNPYVNGRNQVFLFRKDDDDDNFVDEKPCPRKLYRGVHTENGRLEKSGDNRGDNRRDGRNRHSHNVAFVQQGDENARDGGRNNDFCKKSAARKLPPFLSLLKKEFNLVLFTPDYAVQYFTVAAIMPLMVYFCMGIGKNFLTSLVFVQSDFELAILLTVLFGALTNTFCATNVSRDGKSFYVEKTLPLSINEIMGAKIALSFAVAVISVGIAATVLLAKKYVSTGEGVFVFFVGAMMALSQILYATRKDLNSPQFSLEEDNVVRESNNNVSIIVVLGLVSAMLLGGIPLFVNVLSNVRGKDMRWFTYVFVSVCAAAEFVGSLLYYLIGIKARFDRVTEGD